MMGSMSTAMASPPLETPRMRGLPLLGTLPAMQRDVIGTLEQAAQLGDVVRIDLPLRNSYLVSHPDGVRHVLIDNQRAYGKDTRGYKMLSIALGQGLVTAQGDFWRRQRRIAQPAFQAQSLQRFIEVMDEAAVRLVARWRDRLPEGGRLQTDAEMMRVTLEIVGRCLLDTDLSDSSEAVGEAITIVLHETIWRLTHPLALPLVVPTPHNRRLVRALKRMQALIGQILEARRQEAAKDDLLSMLMHAKEEDTGEGMTDTQLRDEVMTMVSAGHETTAVALTWSLYFLGALPEEQARLEAEVDEVLQEGQRLSEASLARLVRTEGVIKEAMRLRPPIWLLARSAREDDVILGKKVPRGSIVFLPQFLLHRDPRFWEAPLRFFPERFLGERAKSIPRHVYFPFAAGPRACIGAGFALTEAKILLARIVREARLSNLPGSVARLDPTVTLRPMGGLEQTLEWRRSSPAKADAQP